MAIDNTYTIRHWMPIITFCPVNHLPDLIYVSVTFKNEFQELYAVRKKIRKLLAFRTIYMESAVSIIQAEFQTATIIELNLLFGRHYIKLDKGI